MSQDNYILELRDNYNQTLLSPLNDNCPEFIFIMSPSRAYTYNCINIQEPEEDGLFIATEDIEQYDLVSVTGVGYDISKVSLDPNQSRKFLGLAMETKAAGTPIKVKISGVIYDPSWNWDTDKELWCGEDSKLTQTPINSNNRVSLKVGEVLTSNMIILSRFEPILL